MAFTCERVGDFWECRDPDEAESWNAAAVGAHLAVRGHALGPGGIGVGIVDDGADDAVLLVRVDLPAGTNPAADLDAYAPPGSPQRAARLYLRGRAQAIRAKAPADRTTAERDLLAMATLLRRVR